jgi:ubiquinone/menaquinone biosynthesis C-methylase UbiE
MHALDRRAEARELLDGDTLDLVDLRANLREMAMLNRLPGGTGASLAAIRHLTTSNAPVILDIGTGGGDLPRRIRRELPNAMVIGTDASAAVLDVARSWTRTGPCLELTQADALQLPMADAAVDVAHASLLVHHLSPAEVVRALGEMRRVARLGVVINDLRRGRLAYALTAATVLGLARHHVTHADGLLSARRSYTLAELDAMAADAGLRRVWRSPAFMPRVVTAYR